MWDHLSPVTWTPDVTLWGCGHVPAPCPSPSSCPSKFNIMSMDYGQNGFHIHSASLTGRHEGDVNATVGFYATQKLTVTASASEGVNSPLKPVTVIFLVFCVTYLVYVTQKVKIMPISNKLQTVAFTLYTCRKCSVVVFPGRKQHMEISERSI